MKVRLVGDLGSGGTDLELLDEDGKNLLREVMVDRLEVRVGQQGKLQLLLSVLAADVDVTADGVLYRWPGVGEKFLSEVRFTDGTVLYFAPVVREP